MPRLDPHPEDRRPVVWEGPRMQRNIALTVIGFLVAAAIVLIFVRASL